jgi:predicted deacylase
MFGFSREKNNLHFKMITIDAENNISIPVADIQGDSPGKTLLVIGGMDGDEYAGIEAAYQLAEKYASKNFAGRLIIIPIFNITGFKSETSQNPLDSQFPKYVFPGKANGTATERMMHWLCEEYLGKVDCWIELHGGALTEELNPYILTYNTGVKHVDAFSTVLAHEVFPANVVYETTPYNIKPKMLAERGCIFVQTEAGGRASCSSEDCALHVSWVESIMDIFNMIDSHRRTNSENFSLMTQVSYVFAPYDGIWRASMNGKDIAGREEIGTYSKLIETTQHPVYAPISGTILYYKQGLAMRKGDVLCAIAN